MRNQIHYESCYVKPNLNSKNAFPIDLTSNGIQYGLKPHCMVSIENELFFIKTFGLVANTENVFILWTEFFFNKLTVNNTNFAHPMIEIIDWTISIVHY